MIGKKKINEGKLKGIKVFQSHGHQDPILPFQLGKLINQMLKEGGATVEFIEFKGAHTIPFESLVGFNQFILNLTK